MLPPIPESIFEAVIRFELSTLCVRVVLNGLHIDHVRVYVVESRKLNPRATQQQQCRS